MTHQSLSKQGALWALAIYMDYTGVDFEEYCISTWTPAGESYKAQTPSTGVVKGLSLPP